MRPEFKRYSDPEGSIYRLKLQYVWIILFPLALLLYAYEDELNAWHSFPYHSVADALLTTAIVAIVFEMYLRTESDRRLSRIVRDTVHAELGPLARSFFSRPKELLEALNDEALDGVITAALAIKLKDENLAAEVESGLLQSIAKYKERWTDANLSVTLTRIEDHPSPEVRERFFDAYVSLRFQTKLSRASFPIWCVSSKEAFDGLSWGSEDCFYAWLQPPTRTFPGVSLESFDVDEVVVDGNRLGRCTSRQPDSGRLVITYQDDQLASLLGQSVIVKATLKVKIPKRAQFINLSVPGPSRDVVMVVHYGETEIRRVEVVDFFVSGRRPEIRHLPTSSSARQNGVEVHLRDWAFPRDGVVFTWHLPEQNAKGVRGSAGKSRELPQSPAPRARPSASA